MRIQFPVSTLAHLQAELRQNPTATGVVLTKAEFIDVTSELLQSGATNAVLMGGNPRQFCIDGRFILVTIDSTP